MYTNKETLFTWDFHLFEGEGGGDAGGLGAEASAFAESIGLDEYSQKKQSNAESVDVAHTQYGKAKGDEARTSQVGSDTGSEAPDLNAEFAELIGKGGRFHDIYGQKVSETVQNRLKNQANLQAQVDGINDALSPMFQRYGLQSGDIEGLKNAIANDDDFYRAAAEKEGISIDSYKENLRLRAEAERGRQITEAYEAQQRQNAMFERWESEASQLQQAFPAFDLGLEIQNNEEFARLIDAGASVQAAFAATHLNDILNGYSADVTRNATENVVNTIQKRASRPIENGVRHAPAIQRKSDPSSLTDEDMDEIIRRTENGESFAF